MTPEERQKMWAEQEAREAWSVKDMVKVWFTTVEEAQEIVDLCETGERFKPYKVTFQHPTHYRTEIGFIRADDYEEAKKYLDKEELKAELKIKPKIDTEPQTKQAIKRQAAMMQEYWRQRGLLGQVMPFRKVAKAAHEVLDKNGDFGMTLDHMRRKLRKILPAEELE